MFAVRFLFNCNGHAQSPIPACSKVLIDVPNPGLQISSSMYGIFLEEMNRSGADRRYGKLIRNRGVKLNLPGGTCFDCPDIIVNGTTQFVTVPVPFGIAGDPLRPVQPIKKKPKKIHSLLPNRSSTVILHRRLKRNSNLIRSPFCE